MTRISLNQTSRVVKYFVALVSIPERLPDFWRIKKEQTEGHGTRVKADLAHAKSKKGVATKPVSFGKRDKLRREAKAPWAELIIEWKKII